MVAAKRLRKGHTWPELTDEQRENLKKVVTYLRSGQLKARFDMTQVCQSNNIPDENRITCGSVGCIVGHAPYAGVKKRRGEDWWDFSERQLGDDQYRIFDWCFTSNWAYDGSNIDFQKIDDRVEREKIEVAEGAHRIEYMLEYGIPPEEKWLSINKKASSVVGSQS